MAALRAGILICRHSHGPFTAFRGLHSLGLVAKSKEVRVLARIGGAMRKVVPSVSAFVLTLLFSLVVGVHPASANTLVSTNPIAGSTLRTSPGAVTITTELPLMDMGNEVSVTDPNGARVDDGTLTVNGTNVVLGMKSLTVNGIYTVTYLLVSENEEPLQGQYRFTYSAAAASAAPTESYSPTPEKVAGSDFATNVFIIALMALAIIVLIALSLYARKLYLKK